MPDAPPLIRLRGVTKRYGEGSTAFLALKGVDLDIERGEFVAIMGPSGSGKSTAMNLLGCLDVPTSGDYMFRGIAVQKKMSVIKGKGVGTETFYLGDLVKIELTVATPTDRLFVFVDDPLPAGFRALNFGLQTTDQSLREFIKGETPFVYSEYKDDRVVFFADYVEKGTHTVSYLVSAEHSGAFNLPPTFSAEMYTPEVFGQTGAAVVNVK